MANRAIGTKGGWRSMEYNGPMPKMLLNPGETVLCEHHPSYASVQYRDSMVVRSKNHIHMALTDQRLLGVRRRRRRGEYRALPFVNVPLDHLVAWEEVKTLRMRWYRARRIHPFVRVEVERPDVVFGFTVPNPQSWINMLDRLTSHDD